jgi:hypothetical protein
MNMDANRHELSYTLWEMAFWGDDSPPFVEGMHETYPGQHYEAIDAVRLDLRDMFVWDVCHFDEHGKHVDIHLGVCLI